MAGPRSWVGLRPNPPHILQSSPLASPKFHWIVSGFATFVPSCTMAAGCKLLFCWCTIGSALPPPSLSISLAPSFQDVVRQWEDMTFLCIFCVLGFAWEHCGTPSSPHHTPCPSTSNEIIVVAGSWNQTAPNTFAPFPRIHKGEKKVSLPPNPLF